MRSDFSLENIIIEGIKFIVIITIKELYNRSVKNVGGHIIPRDPRE